MKEVKSVLNFRVTGDVRDRVRAFVPPGASLQSFETISALLECAECYAGERARARETIEDLRVKFRFRDDELVQLRPYVDREVLRVLGIFWSDLRRRPNREVKAAFKSLFDQERNKREVED